VGAKQVEPLSIYTMAAIIAAREQAKHKHCNFCHDGNFIESSDKDIVWYLDPKDDYARTTRKYEHVNIQIDINDEKYPDSRSGDDTNAQFWFNYCPMCGRKLDE